MITICKTLITISQTLLRAARRSRRSRRRPSVLALGLGRGGRVVTARRRARAAGRRARAARRGARFHVLGVVPPCRRERVLRAQHHSSLPKSTHVARSASFLPVEEHAFRALIIIPPCRRARASSARRRSSLLQRTRVARSASFLPPKEHARRALRLLEPQPSLSCSIAPSSSFLCAARSRAASVIAAVVTGARREGGLELTELGPLLSSDEVMVLERYALSLAATGRALGVGPPAA